VAQDRQRLPKNEFEYDLFEILNRPQRFLFTARDRRYIKQVVAEEKVAAEDLRIAEHALFTMTDETDPFLSLLTDISEAAQGDNLYDASHIQRVSALCSQIHLRLAQSRIDWRNKRFSDHMVRCLEQLKQCAVDVPLGFNVASCVSTFRYLLAWDVKRFRIFVGVCRTNHDTIRLEVLRVKHEGLL
jgi:hypothetical protein